MESCRSTDCSHQLRSHSSDRGRSPADRGWDRSPTSQSWQWWAAHTALGLVQQILTKAGMELSVWMLSKQKMWDHEVSRVTAAINNYFKDLRWSNLIRLHYPWKQGMIEWSVKWGKVEKIAIKGHSAAHGAETTQCLAILSSGPAGLN